MSKPRSFFLVALTLVGSLALTLHATAQKARLLKDINKTRLPALSSHPIGFADVGGRVAFGATTEQYGRTLLISDGTAIGTKVIGNVPGASDPSWITSLGRIALFSGFDGTAHGLMVTDGTRLGTKPVVSTAQIASPSRLVRFGNRVVFSAIAGGAGSEPCISDGTAVGTTLLKDIVPGAGSSNPGPFLVVGKVLYFLANATSTTVEFWRTDGSTVGTVLVTRVKSTYSGSAPPSLMTMGSRVVIELNGTVFVSNGAASGTTKVADGRIIGATAQHVYYTTQSTSYRFDHELWKNDATGTYVLTSLASLYGLGLYRSRAYFAGPAWSPSGIELWATDGTVAGTRLFLDIHTGPADSNPGGFAVAGNRLWFSAETAAGGEPWSTDGTVAGTKMVADVHFRAKPSNNGSMPLDSNGGVFADIYGSTWFLSSYPSKLWKTDGTTAGTTEVASLGGDSRSGRLKAAMGRLFFSAGDKLWSSDGTAAGTRMLASFGSLPWAFSDDDSLEIDGALLFSGADSRGSELWRTDGTAAGTVLVKDIITGAGGSHPVGFVSVGKEAVFFTKLPGATPLSVTSEMWKTDGTATGTAKISSLGGQRIIGNPVTYGQGRCLFITASSASQFQLWSSDGSVAGTRQVKTFVGVSFSGGSLAGGDSKGAFVFHHTLTGSSLWFTDGTAAGTVQLQTGSATLARGQDSAEMLGNRLIYEFPSTSGDRELYTSDGTVGGTRLLSDLVPGSWSSAPHDFVRVGSRYLYFVAGDSERRLWRTDGTAKGTVKLTGVAGPRAIMAVSDGKLYFVGDDPHLGLEPFVADLDATTIPVGRGCGERRGTDLFAADPVIGVTGQLRLRGAVPSRAGLTLIGAKPRDVRSVMQLAGGCLVMMDLGVPAFSFPIRTNATGAATVALPIPNNPALIGVDMMTQAVVGPTKGAMGIDLSAALHFVFGY